MSDHFADSVPARGPSLFPAFQNQLRLPQARFSRPDSPAESQMSPYQSASVSGVNEGPGINDSSKDANTKGRMQNNVFLSQHGRITIQLVKGKIHLCGNLLPEN